MFNLFPKKKSVEELVDSVGPFDVYRSVQTPSYIQAQQDMIDDLFKKNYELKKENEKIKKENVELMERVNEIDNDVIRDLKDEIFVLKNDYAVLKARHQSLDEQCDEVKKSQNWSTLKIAMEDAVQAKWKELPKTFPNEFQEEPAFLSCACGDCYEETKQYNLFQKAKKLTEGVDLDKSLDEQPKSTRGKVHMEFPNEVPHEWEAKPETFPNEFQEFEECKITGYKIPKEKSWEEAASDLALRVVKLEKQVEELKLIKI